MELTPKAKRNISKIIPFSVIWVISGWAIIITELGVTRNQNYNPETDITLTLPVFIFASFANILVGLMVGILEVIYLQRRFASQSLKTKFFNKFLIYFTLFIVVIVAFYPIAFSVETGISILKTDGWIKLGKFLQSTTFLTTLFHLNISLFLCLVYSAISENLGHHVFQNLLTGKYHQPVEEQRIFMFLDMKSSTTIAEKIGHAKYFRLLQAYYDAMSDPIVNSLGEVYQYIGDEIVISWKLHEGITESHCIQCFFDIKESLSAQNKKLKQEFGFEIDFKAGIHVGDVTVGVIGALKKEIVFTGDVLNTAARIQSQCNELSSSLLVSKTLLNLLPVNTYHFVSKGELHLKGKEQTEELYSVLLE